MKVFVKYLPFVLGKVDLTADYVFAERNGILHLCEIFKVTTHGRVDLRAATGVRDIFFTSIPALIPAAAYAVKYGAEPDDLVYVDTLEAGIQQVKIHRKTFLQDGAPEPTYYYLDSKSHEQLVSSPIYSVIGRLSDKATWVRDHDKVEVARRYQCWDSNNPADGYSYYSEDLKRPGKTHPVASAISDEESPLHVKCTQCNLWH